mmetsp:Transcript_15456/g.50819  ORF Transcript_15456/g.50819 Transcript_15456/m.50819 type:complete len:211 (-) Transcript_15456:159-791(-)
MAAKADATPGMRNCALGSAGASAALPRRSASASNTPWPHSKKAASALGMSGRVSSFASKRAAISRRVPGSARYALHCSIKSAMSGGAPDPAGSSAAAPSAARVSRITRSNGVNTRIESQSNSTDRVSQALPPASSSPPAPLLASAARRRATVGSRSAASCGKNFTAALRPRTEQIALASLLTRCVRVRLGASARVSARIREINGVTSDSR